MTNLPPEAVINYDLFITEDDKPVDSLYSERQHRLLTDILYASWKGPGEGRPRYVSTDVGLFYDPHEPALSPDVLISLDVALPQDAKPKKGRSYFMWLCGKPPDLVVEVVSNTEGNELTGKLETFARIGIPYYVVWDPFGYLSATQLQCFANKDGQYVPTEPWFPELELGATAWEGEYDGYQKTWLRWCDQQGKLLRTGVERAEAAEQRAEVAKLRAEKLAEKLRALGIDPENNGD